MLFNETLKELRKARMRNSDNTDNLQIGAENDIPMCIKTASTDDMIRNLHADVKEARETAYRKVKQEKRSAWLSDETLEFIHERQRAREQMHGMTEGMLHKKIKYAI